VSEQLNFVVEVPSPTCHLLESAHVKAVLPFAACTSRRSLPQISKNFTPHPPPNLEIQKAPPLVLSKIKKPHFFGCRD
jgi:hypothetical protein